MVVGCVQIILLFLGFGLSVDLLKLKESINMNDVKMAGLGFLDLNLLWKKLMREFNITLPFKGNVKNCCISKLCHSGAINVQDVFPT